MKKFLAALLALALMMTVVSALATEDAAPSKTIDALTPMIDESKADIVNAEIDKLNEKGVDEYFGKGDEISAIMGEGEYNVHEFAALIFAEYTGEDDEVLVKLPFPTPYEEGSTVAVMIGIYGEPIEWTAYEGTVIADGIVQFKMPVDAYKEVVAAETVLVSVISK